MKKFTLLSSALFFCVASFIGCSTPDVSSPSVDKSPEREEPFQSEISLLEKEMGVSYFKKDVVIHDKSGKNSITMRFASLSNEVLNNYLTSVKYEIVPTDGKKSTTNNQQSNSPETSDAPAPTTFKSDIITEIVSKNLQKGIAGYYVTVMPSNHPSARTTDDGPYSTSHMSEDWPERMHFTLNAPTNYINDRADFYVRIKNGGLFSTWQSIPQLDRISPAPAGMVTNHVYLNYTTANIDWVYNVDGPKKVELFVNFTRIGGYSYWFQQL